MHALIVDDDKANQYLLQQYLAPFGSCDIAANGEEALNRFRKAIDDHKPYDLVCLDIMMPGIDGIQVLREIREEEAQRGIALLDGAKVIMITSIAETTVAVSAFRDGCEAYLIKPLNREDLIRNLKTLKLIPANI